MAEVTICHARCQPFYAQNTPCPWHPGATYVTCMACGPTAVRTTAAARYLSIGFPYASCALRQHDRTLSGAILPPPSTHPGRKEGPCKFKLQLSSRAAYELGPLPMCPPYRIGGPQYIYGAATSRAQNPDHLLISHHQMLTQNQLYHTLEHRTA